MRGVYITLVYSTFWKDENNLPWQLTVKCGVLWTDLHLYTLAFLNHNKHNTLLLVSGSPVYWCMHGFSKNSLCTYSEKFEFNLATQTYLGIKYLQSSFILPLWRRNIDLNNFRLGVSNADRLCHHIKNSKFLPNVPQHCDYQLFTWLKKHIRIFTFSMKYRAQCQ